MLTLFLMRHAKSSWSHPELSDAERPLNLRGQKAAVRMGSYLREEAIKPSLILCSASQRTRETLSNLLPHVTHDSRIQVLEEIYRAGDSLALARTVRHWGGNNRRILMIGHNPSVQDFTLAHCRNDPENLLDEVNLKFPTGAMVEIQFPIQSWDKLSENGMLNRFVRPRLLPSQA